MTKFKIKETYLLMLIVVGLISLGIYTTYAMFTASTTLNDVVGITTALDVGKGLTEYEVVTVGSGETKLIELNIVNSYSSSIYYGAWYQIVQGNSSDIDIGLYTEKNSNPSSGSLATNGSINLLAGVTNNGTSSITVYIGAKGSLTNELNLGSNKTLLPSGFTEGYTVTLNLTNGTVNNTTVSSIKVKEGKTASFTITPDTDYKLIVDTQTCDGVLNPDTGSFTIENITCDKNCNISLREKPIKSGSLGEKILIDTPTVNERTSFNSWLTSDTTGTIFKTNLSEDVDGDGTGDDVYYYAGNTSSNWVKFGSYNSNWYQWVQCEPDLDGCVSPSQYAVGKSCVGVVSGSGADNKCKQIASNGDSMYWRIIRINEDGSVRMMYAGSSSTNASGISTTNIGTTDYYYSYYDGAETKFNQGVYMFGGVSSNYFSNELPNLRKNTTSSVPKKSLDTWYSSYLLTNYDKYISKTAVYCSDRSPSTSVYHSGYGLYYYAAVARVGDYTPSYLCGSNGRGGLFETTQAIEDKFSVSTASGGNGNLTYPIALITADEVSFAGGSVNTNSSGTIWLASYGGWTLSPLEPGYPSENSYDKSARIIAFSGGYINTSTAQLNYLTSSWRGNKLHPVISIKSCVKYSSGNGTSTNPYIVTVDDTCTNKEN